MCGELLDWSFAHHLVHACTRSQIMGKRALSIVKAEKEALMLLAENKCHFCLFLLYAFQDEKEFCLVMPLAIGGDLRVRKHGCMIQRTNRMGRAC